MASVVNYKQRNRKDRRTVLETDFSHGMMSTNGIVDEGYVRSLVNFTFEKESGTIIPRPGLNASSFIFTEHDSSYAEDYLSDKVTIKASKSCVEQGVTYNQNILGKLNSDSNTKGLIWVCTSFEEEDPTNIKFSEEYSDYITFAGITAVPPVHTAYYFTSGNAAVHKVPLSEDTRKRIETPIGCFAFGNNYYFLGEHSETVEQTTTVHKGLYRTSFDTDHYIFEQVTPKVLSVSEAVTYGYNMLLGDQAYSFSDQHSMSSMMFEGILPYDPSTDELLMTPKKNQTVKFRAYYNSNVGRKFNIVWEWRETTSADWTPIANETVIVASDTKLELVFQPPAADMMVRVAAYPFIDDNGDVDDSSDTISDTVEKAIVVGFDFTVENYGSATAIDQKVYDLTTAVGMASWNGRIVLWGITDDPTILFISDYNEPSYFPYPNNITVFDEPIIDAVEFMDTLCVFTTNKLYQVVLADDGNSWKSTILQSHLNINPWDRHLIQTVRNMLYFKSGNYYYMMVPKAQSTTGELVLAPITTPITSFFDNFSVNVQEVLKNTYGYTGVYDLLTYYNYLDYEDIHNVYVYSFDESTNVFHFDVIYNTVDRTWKVWIYEATNFLFPYRHDATQTGLLASTSLIKVLDVVDDYSESYNRLIQIFKWNKLTVAEYYVPDSLALNYLSNEVFAVFDDTEESVTFHPLTAVFSDDSVIIYLPLAYFENGDTYFQDITDYFGGLNKRDIILMLKDVYSNFEAYYSFLNYQFLDTGYRDDEVQYKKRYREIQLQINNLDKKNLDFGMEYILDGAPRKLLYKYDTTQDIDEFDPEYGVVYVDTTPYLEVDLNDIDISNQWTIDQNLVPDISLWKVRVSISGKGSAPRFKLYSRNTKRFELIGINWVSRIMHAR